MSNLDYLTSLQDEIRDKKWGIVTFAEKVLGLPVRYHKGQLRWLMNSKKRINILRPGNKYGKSLIGAVKHIYHSLTKWNMWGLYRNSTEWEKLKYETLNFGPGYEQAREIARMVRDLCQGSVFIPIEYHAKYGVTNRSLLKDWFVVNDKADTQVLPSIEFWGGAKLLIRSYDEMGSAFKMKGIAYVSGDEVADIQELWTFTNGTLLPRGVAYRNFSIDYYGTPQPEGHDYMRMIQMAEEDMARPDWKTTGMFYVQKGSMFENPFLDKETVKAVSAIADPVMRRQIIMGEYVETGSKYFGYDRISNAVDAGYKPLSQGLPSRRYVVGADFAGGESVYADDTVVWVVDATEEPYKSVYYERIKGNRLPIPSQYKLVEDIVGRFKDASFDTRLVIDASALGGQNAKAFLKHLNPICINFTPVMKAEMLATLKIAFDGGQSETRKRKVEYDVTGTGTDKNPQWGIIKIPPDEHIIAEFQNYKLDDKKIKTDCVMSLAMIVHYIELRRPKKVRRSAVPFDLLAI